MEELSGKDWNGQKLYAARAQKRAERQMDLKSQFEKRKIERINRYQGVNLYVKNLDDTIDDARLREEFSAYGTITSAKVMMDDKNNSKGRYQGLENNSLMFFFVKLCCFSLVNDCLDLKILGRVVLSTIKLIQDYCKFLFHFISTFIKEN